MNAYNDTEAPLRPSANAGVEGYIDRVGELYRQGGRTALEGRLVALLVTVGGPVSLSEAALRLGTTKASLSKLTREMMEAGDLKGFRDFSSRQHRYDLVDGLHTRDLKERVAHYSALTEAAEVLAAQPHLPPQALERLTRQATLLREATRCLEAALAPSLAQQAVDLARHGRDWDAMPLRTGFGQD